jgi:hypothetical protein
MSGGIPSANALATIKHNGDSAEPGLGLEELIRRKRAELGPLEPQPLDTADIALRDVTSGRVRRARAGSSRNSILGQALYSE